MGQLRSLESTDPSSILSHLLSDIKEVKPLLDRDANFHLELIEKDILRIQEMGFDRNSALQAHLLYFAIDRHLKEIKNFDANPHLQNMAKNIRALQTQQHPHLLVVLVNCYKLGSLGGLSDPQKMQIVNLQKEILSTFEKPETSPEEKLNALIKGLKTLATSSGVSTFFGASGFKNQLNIIIASIASVPINRPTPGAENK